MPSDLVRLDALHTALRDAVDAHVGALSEEHAQALEAARREGASAAEQDAAARLDALRTELRNEWSARLQAELDAARAEGERRLVAETTKARTEMEQAAAESTAQLRMELERTAAAERQRLETEIAAEQERAQEAIRAERQRAEAAIAAAQAHAQARAEAHAEAQAQAAAQPAADTSVSSLVVSGLHAVNAATSLGGVFAALLDAAASLSSRALVFVVSGDHLKGWSGSGFDGFDPAGIDNPIAGDGLLATAVKWARTCAASPNHPAPSFGALPADAAAIAVPLILGGHVVAVLYADQRDPSDTRPAGWVEGIELLAQHGATALALLTATRTLELLGRSGSTEADEQSARRYARLLISEIKLYNETAVRLGRQQRDLLERLGPEIARARRLYEERVPGGRTAFFQQELLQTLADGDARLLGAS